MSVIALFVMAILGLMTSIHAKVWSASAVVTRTVIVDLMGSGNFTNIQAAVDSVPPGNTEWIRIHVKQGVYKEIVKIPVNKGFILLEGEGKMYTFVESARYQDVNSAAALLEDSATFTTMADNVVVKHISFRNTYTVYEQPVMPALAAYVFGDKTAFYDCGFYGYQDTLGDMHGRHYFSNCDIEGVVDFIFGAGKSIYKSCNIITVDNRGLTQKGWITAQGRERQNDTNGFVFKNCYISGESMADLARSWKPFATVIFFRSYMTKIVAPEGYSAGKYDGQETNMFYVEEQCIGPGSNQTSRVPWMKKPSRVELLKYVSMDYINKDGWLEQQP